MMIRVAVAADCEELGRLRGELWPGAEAEEVEEIVGTGRCGTMPGEVFVAEDGGKLIGFVEVSLRSHADGCDTSQPAGFLEGWFVAEGARRKGIGAKLLSAAEEWARKQGCVEMASDTWIEHELSQRVHEALDFEVVDRCVHYKKKL